MNKTSEGCVWHCKHPLAERFPVLVEHLDVWPLGWDVATGKVRNVTLVVSQPFQYSLGGIYVARVLSFVVGELLDIIEEL